MRSVGINILYLNLCKLWSSCCHDPKYSKIQVAFLESCVQTGQMVWFCYHRAEVVMLLHRTSTLNQNVAAHLRITICLRTKNENLAGKKKSLMKWRVKQPCTRVHKLVSKSNEVHKIIIVLKPENPGFQELPSPFLVLSTTRLTMTGIRHIGVITRAKTMAGGGSRSSSVGQSLKNWVWRSTNISSTRGLGHGTKRQSNTCSVQRLRLLYKLQFGDRTLWVHRRVSNK